MQFEEVQLIGSRLRQFGFKNLSEYYASEQWQTKKQFFYFDKDNPKCYYCNSSYRLDTHHKHYRNLCEEQECDFLILCRTCHSKTHKFCDSIGCSVFCGTQKAVKIIKKRNKSKKYCKEKWYKNKKALEDNFDLSDMNCTANNPVKRYFINPVDLLNGNY